MKHMPNLLIAWLLELYLVKALLPEFAIAGRIYTALRALGMLNSQRLRERMWILREPCDYRCPLYGLRPQILNLDLRQSSCG
jgi:hypothetical protein